VELLSLAKKNYNYRQLAAMTNLPITVLSRYVRGHVLPSAGRTEALRKALEPVVSLEALLRQGIHFDEQGYFDNSSIVWDINILRLAAYRAIELFAGRKITKILTAAVDGVPFATIVASEMGKGLVVAKKEREVGIQDFVEESFVPSNSAIVMTLHIPRHAIRRGDSVLIVDDIISDGDTHRALVNLVAKAKASVVGMFSLVSVGDAWRQRIQLDDSAFVHSAVKVEPPKYGAQ